MNLIINLEVEIKNRELESNLDFLFIIKIVHRFFLFYVKHRFFMKNRI